MSGRLQQELWLGAAAAFVMTLLPLALNLGDMRELLLSQLWAAPIYLAGGMLAFAPLVVAVALSITLAGGEAAPADEE